MKIGYARVSTVDQVTHSQHDALTKAGCDKIYSEKKSGKSRKNRIELSNMLKELRQGDVVYVWRLERLTRSLPDLIDIINEIESKKAQFICLTLPLMDTTTPIGKFIFFIFALLSQFTREVIVESTKEGLQAARARGRIGGRPKGLSKKNQEKALVAQSLYDANKHSVAEICAILGMSKTTLYRYIQRKENEK